MKIQLTENFYLNEFTCKDKSDIDYKVFNNIIELAKQMQVIRDSFNAPIIINSAYRSPAYNSMIGGAKQSKHKLGQACDFTVKGFTPNQVHLKLLGLIKEGLITKGGVGQYNSFTHYDIRGTKARWDNR
jgi:uncharacterized protein YcbK (DUF882 family)